MEQDKPGASSTECAPEQVRKRFHIGAPLDVEKLEEERKTLEGLNKEPFLKRIFGFSKFTGPGFIQSAVTLGAGSAGSCLIAGSMFGYRLIWVQPVAMILGMFMFFAMAKQAVVVRRCAYEAMRTELHYVFAFLFGLSALLASILWHFPQYSLAGDVANNLASVVTGSRRPIPAWILGPIFLGFAVFVTWNYGKGIRGIRVYEKTLKLLVWLIVVAFALVVIKTGINFKEFFKGFVPKIPRLPDGSFDREQANLMIALLGAAVGVNMVFLYPYSLMARGWGKEHQRLAYFDLMSAMFIPFILATGLVVVATSNTLHQRGVVESGNTAGDHSVVVNVGKIASESNVTVTFDAIVSERLPQKADSVSCDLVVTGRRETEGEPRPVLEKKRTLRTPLNGAKLSEMTAATEDKAPQLKLESSFRLLTDRDKDGIPSVGDTLHYEVKIANAGQVALSDVLLRGTPDPNTDVVPGSVHSRTITRSALEAARVLAPVVGATFGRVIFGIGMLAIALSTITVHMLMCAFIVSEMFGIDPTGWKYRLMVLTPAIGAFGVAWKLPFGVAVFASSTCVIFLPMAYVCFMVLHNKKRFMGDAMPRGGKRVLWNAGMALAIAVVTLFAVVKLSILYGDVKKRVVKPKARAEARINHPRVVERPEVSK